MSLFHYEVPGGESPAQVAARAHEFVQELFTSYKGKTVVLVAHGGSIRSLILLLLNEPPENLESFRHKNTALSIIEISDDGKHVAHLINDASHLDR